MKAKKDKEATEAEATAAKIEAEATKKAVKKKTAKDLKLENAKKETAESPAKDLAESKAPEDLGEDEFLGVEEFYSQTCQLATSKGYKPKDEKSDSNEDDVKIGLFVDQKTGVHSIDFEMSYEEGFCLSYPVDQVTDDIRTCSGVLLNKDSLSDMSDFFSNARDHHNAMPVLETQVEEEKEPRTDYSKHYQFDEILTLTKIAPLWLYGAPAAGKTYIGAQIAKELGVNYYPVPLGPTVGETRLTGYTSAAHGDYVKGLCYDPFKDGGLLMLDEIDVADPQILVSLNSMLDGGEYYRFPNGEMVKRHKNFYVIAGANTSGTGGVGNFKRNAHDAALLSRFIRFQMKYDLALESHISKDTNWAAYIAITRKWAISQASGSFLVSPRKTYQGADMLRAGILPSRVYEILIQGDMVKDVAKRFEGDIGVYDPTVEYIKHSSYKTLEIIS